MNFFLIKTERRVYEKIRKMKKKDKLNFGGEKRK